MLVLSTSHFSFINNHIRQSFIYSMISDASMQLCVWRLWNSNSATQMQEGLPLRVCIYRTKHKFSIFSASEVNLKFKRPVMWICATILCLHVALHLGSSSKIRRGIVELRFEDLFLDQVYDEKNINYEPLELHDLQE